MIELSPEAIAAATGAEVAGEGERGRPERAVIDSREAGPGALFFGLRGEHADGGEFAAAALASRRLGGGRGPERAAALADDAGAAGGWVLAVADPLVALQRLATAWRRELDCPVVGITGSTGKTSVKDICRGLLPMRVQASPENYNTEIGLPLAILAAPAETEVLVLEMAMRGKGQIAELCEIAEPDVGAITNVGPVHLELLGTLEAIAEAKAEILDRPRRGRSRRRPRRRRGARAASRRPAGRAHLRPGRRRLRDRRRRLRALAGGDDRDAGRRGAVRVSVRRGPQPDQRAVRRGDRRRAGRHTGRDGAAGVADNLLAPSRGDGRPRRGDRARERLLQRQPGLDARGARPSRVARGDGRHIAVLGEMRELGPDAEAYHREVGAHAARLGIGPIIGVGELARAYAPDAWAADAQAAAAELSSTLRPGDAVLVKGSRAVGLELVADELIARHGDGAERAMSVEFILATVAASAVDRAQILIAGMAAMLITIFLGPKFIDYLRVKEFGQQIREEGPQEHHAKAGTPTMGGLILFVAIAVPFLVLGPRDTRAWRSSASPSGAPPSASPTT